MSSNLGDVSRQPEHLNADDPNAAGDQLSEVGSFSRTRPDVVDDEDDLDSNPPPDDEEGDVTVRLNLEDSTAGSNLGVQKGIASPDPEPSIQVGYA